MGSQLSLLRLMTNALSSDPCTYAKAATHAIAGKLTKHLHCHFTGMGFSCNAVLQRGQKVLKEFGAVSHLQATNALLIRLGMTVGTLQMFAGQSVHKWGCGNWVNEL